MDPDDLRRGAARRRALAGLSNGDIRLYHVDGTLNFAFKEHANWW